VTTEAVRKDGARAVERLLPWLAAAVALVLYLPTLAPGLVAGDAGELQAAAAGLGVAHPTGYPLYLQTGLLFLALGGAWGLNLFSAAAMALAAGLAVRLGLRLTGSVLAGVFVGVLVTLGQLAWFEALSAEVYALALALQLVCLSLALELRGSAGPTGAAKRDAKPDSRFFPLLALAYGLALAHHLSALFLLPALLVLVPWRDLEPRSGALAAAAFLLGLSAYLYLPLRAVSASAVNWGDPRTLGALLEHLRGGDYGTALFGGTATGYLGRLGRLALRLVMERGWLILVPILLGAVFSFAERPRWAAALVSWVVLGLLVTAGYAKPDVDAYLLGPAAALALLAGLGLARAQRRLKDNWLGRSMPLLPAAVVGILFAYHVGGSRAEDRLAERFAADLLRAAPPDSQLLARSDDPFGALALHEASDLRPDVEPLFRFLRRTRTEYGDDFLLPALRAHRPVTGLVPELLPGRGLQPTGLGYRYPSVVEGATVSVLAYLERRPGVYPDLASRNLALQYPLSRLFQALGAGRSGCAAGQLILADLTAGGYWQPRSRLAETLDVLGLGRLALGHYEAAVSGAPDDAALLANAGALAAELGDDDRAVDYLKRARELSGPSALAAGENLALYYESKGYLSEAERAWRWLLGRAPDEAGVHSNLAANLVRQERPGEAETAYRRALELDPAYLDALTGLAAVLMGGGRLDEAEALLARARRVAPGAAVVSYDLGLLHQARGELDLAAARFDDAFRADPTMTQALLNQAVCTHEAGRYDEAEELYRRCLALAPEEPEVYFHFARLVELSPVGASDAAILYREFLRLAGPRTPSDQKAFAEARLAQFNETPLQ
jgi:tetratricopeptide (TPR) repeat protein